MDKLLSMLLGVTENVLSGVPIRNHSVLYWMLWFWDFAPLIWPQAFGVPTELEKPLG